MSGPPINLMAGLKDLGPKGKPGQKMGIEIRSDDLWFDPDDKALAKAIANACLVQIREQLEQGNAPNGTPLPSVKSTTLDRRDVEVAQADRAGVAHPRYHDQEFRTHVLGNYTRDYTAPRIGVMTPKDGTKRGIVSGMLVKSFAARPAKDGKGVLIFVAKIRGAPRPGRVRPAEKLSAIESVFAGVPVWDDSAMHSPQMRKAMKEAADNLLSKSRGASKVQWMKLAKELGETFEQAKSFADDAG